MAEFAAPPSYDDVVPPRTGGSLQPTAPPRDHINIDDQPPAQQFDPRPLSASPAQRHRAPANTRVPGQSAKLESCIERYVTYSIARHLRKYIEPKTDQQDPELDVEAQFGRSAVRTAQLAIEKKRRLQCVSGWLWCIGVVIVIVYLALPTAMIIVGAVGIERCPFHNNTIVIYLLGGGVSLALLIIIRTLPSVMTCIRNRDYCSTGNSNSCAGCICSVEILFYIVLFVNVTALILGTYTTFIDPKPRNCPTVLLSEVDCCDPLVFVSSAFFTVFQYVLYLVTGLFVCLVLSCIRSMDKEMGA